MARGRCGAAQGCPLFLCWIGGLAVNAVALNCQAGDLVRRIAGGDPAAEEELFLRYGAGIRFLLERWCRDGETAADLHQETLRLALQKIRRGEVHEPDRIPAF